MRIEHLAAAIAVAAMSSVSLATIQVTDVQVSHKYEYPYANPANEGTSLVLSSGATGNSFATFDGHTGVTSTMTAIGGTFRIDGTSTGNDRDDPTLAPSDYNASTTGTVLFSVAGGTLSVTPGGHAGNGDNSYGEVIVTNLATLQYFEYQFQGPQIGVVAYGNLPAVAPAGNYKLEWSISAGWAAGQGTSDELTANLVSLPEPVVVAPVLAVLSLIARRRR